ncbi:hypothetical protein SEVIR_9G422300v4 [Setaria viridis]
MTNKSNPARRRATRTASRGRRSQDLTCAGWRWMGTRRQGCSRACVLHKPDPRAPARLRCRNRPDRTVPTTRGFQKFPVRPPAAQVSRRPGPLLTLTLWSARPTNPTRPEPRPRTPRPAPACVPRPPGAKWHARRRACRGPGVAGGFSSSSRRSRPACWGSNETPFTGRIVLPLVDNWVRRCCCLLFGVPCRTEGFRSAE